MEGTCGARPISRAGAGGAPISKVGACGGVASRVSGSGDGASLEGYFGAAGGYWLFSENCGYNGCAGASYSETGGAGGTPFSTEAT